MQEPILLQLDAQGRVVLPKAIRGKDGSFYTCVTEDDGTVHLIPVVGVITKKQAYFWSKRWQSGEAQASKDLKKGKFKTIPSNNIDDYLDTL